MYHTSDWKGCAVDQYCGMYWYTHCLLAPLLSAKGVFWQAGLVRIVEKISDVRAFHSLLHETAPCGRTGILVSVIFAYALSCNQLRNLTVAGILSNIAP